MYIPFWVIIAVVIALGYYGDKTEENEQRLEDLEEKLRFEGEFDY